MKKVLLLCFVLCVSLAFVAQAAATGLLFRVNVDNGTIEELNPDTGAVMTSFTPPISPGACSGLAFAKSRLFYQTCGSDIYELSPSSGAVINSFPGPSPFSDGLGFSGTELYTFGSGIRAAAAKSTGSAPYAGTASGDKSEKAVAPAGGPIYALNPDTGAILRTLTPSFPIGGGLTYAGGRNTLFASGSSALNIPAIFTIYELNPETGAVVNSFTPPAPGIFGVGYSFARKTLFLGDVGGPATIYEVNPDTGAVIHTLPVVPNWGLAADENDITAAAVPTMNEWGIILFIALAGLTSLYLLKEKKKRTES
jgi:hypothetical protein